MIDWRDANPCYKRNACQEDSSQKVVVGSNPVPARIFFHAKFQLNITFINLEVKVCAFVCKISLNVFDLSHV